MNKKFYEDLNSKYAWCVADEDNKIVALNVSEDSATNKVHWYELYASVLGKKYQAFPLSLALSHGFKFSDKLLDQIVTKFAEAKDPDRVFRAETWKALLGQLSIEGYSFDEHYYDEPYKWIKVSDSKGNTYEIEITKYFRGGYEILPENINLVSSEESLKGENIYGLFSFTNEDEYKDFLKYGGFTDLESCKIARDFEANTDEEAKMIADMNIDDFGIYSLCKKYTDDDYEPLYQKTEGVWHDLNEDTFQEKDVYQKLDDILFYVVKNNIDKKYLGKNEDDEIFWTAELEDAEAFDERIYAEEAIEDLVDSSIPDQYRGSLDDETAERCLDWQDEEIKNYSIVGIRADSFHESKLKESALHHYVFLFSDGNGAASRGTEVDNYINISIDAENLNDAATKAWAKFNGYDSFEAWAKDEEYEPEEIESIRADVLGYIDDFDISGGDPWVEAIKEDDKIIREPDEDNMKEYGYEFNDLADAEFWGLRPYFYDDDEDDEDESAYDAGHAAEWMDRNPYGYYNNEDDYGTGNEDLDESKKIRESEEKCKYTPRKYSQYWYGILDTEKDLMIWKDAKHLLLFHSKDEAQKTCDKLCKDDKVEVCSDGCLQLKEASLPLSKLLKNYYRTQEVGTPIDITYADGQEVQIGDTFYRDSVDKYYTIVASNDSGFIYVDNANISRNTTNYHSFGISKGKVLPKDISLKNRKGISNISMLVESKIRESEEEPTRDELRSKINDYMTPKFKEDEWEPKDIDIWKSIDWKARNYEDCTQEDPTLYSDVYLYGEDGLKIKKEIAFYKTFRANPIYPPYYKCIEKFPGYTDGMFDGRYYGKYMLMDRYETWDLYKTMSESFKLEVFDKNGKSIDYQAGFRSPSEARGFVDYNDDKYPAGYTFKITENLEKNPRCTKLNESKEAEKALEDLFDQYVPMEGMAKTIGGEIVRAINRIVYRYYNDGDMIGYDYGVETCNSSYGFLKRYVGDIYDKYKPWEYMDDIKYKDFLDELEDVVYTYLTEHEDVFTKNNIHDSRKDYTYEDFTPEEEEEDEYYESKMKEDFWNPSKIFEVFCDEINEPEADLWNKMTSKEREDALRPEIEKFLNNHRDDLNRFNIDQLMDDLVDNNWHTEARVLRGLLEKKVEESRSFKNWPKEKQDKYLKYLIEAGKKYDKLHELKESYQDNLEGIRDFVDSYCYVYGYDFSEKEKDNLAKHMLGYINEMCDEDFDINNPDNLDDVIRKYLENPEDFKEN